MINLELDCVGHSTKLIQECLFDIKGPYEPPMRLILLLSNEVNHLFISFYRRHSEHCFNINYTWFPLTYLTIIEIKLQL